MCRVGVGAEYVELVERGESVVLGEGGDAEGECGGGEDSGLTSDGQHGVARCDRRYLPSPAASANSSTERNRFATLPAACTVITSSAPVCAWKSSSHATTWSAVPATL